MKVPKNGIFLRKMEIYEKIHLKRFFFSIFQSGIFVVKNNATFEITHSNNGFDNVHHTT